MSEAATEPSTLRDLVGAYLSEQCSVIIDSEQALLAGRNVVHPTRVAIRRLRSTLRVFPELFDVAQAAQLEEELLWWAAQLGAVRDLDVLGKRLDGMIAELPPELVLGSVASQVQTAVAVQRKQGNDLLLAELAGDRFRALIALLHRWRSEEPYTPAADRPAGKIAASVKSAGKKVQRRLKTAVEATLAEAEDRDDLLHRARKAGKRHRYAAEAALPLLGAKAEAIIAERKELQDVLGEHQDSVVSAAFLRDLGARLGSRSGHNGFTYGLLYAREAAVKDRALADLQRFV